MLSTLHRSTKKRVVYSPERDSEMNSEDSDEEVAAPKRKKAVRISIESVSDEFKLDLVDKTHDKAFVGHGEVPSASFMDDTAIDLPDNDEQGNNTNADNVVS